jgi:hypothetical protein
MGGFTRIKRLSSLYGEFANNISHRCKDTINWKRSKLSAFGRRG